MDKDIDYLNDLDRGDYDCRKGFLHKEGQSHAYDIGYGARYVYEQMQSADSVTNGARYVLEQMQSAGEIE